MLAANCELQQRHRDACSPQLMIRCDAHGEVGVQGCIYILRVKLAATFPPESFGRYSHRRAAWIRIRISK